MTVDNSKYIYPFGGSTKSPDVDPDKQIGERSIIVFIVFRYEYDRDCREERYLMLTSCGKPH